jgi:hypothetical protein
MENGKSLALVPFSMTPVYTEGGLAPALCSSNHHANSFHGHA